MKTVEVLQDQPALVGLSTECAPELQLASAEAPQCGLTTLKLKAVNWPSYRCVTVGLTFGVPPSSEIC